MNRFFLTLLVLGAASSCVGTPLPDPPALDHEALLIHEDGEEAVVIEAQAGSLDLEQSVIHIWNINRTEPASSAPVRADGGFYTRVLGRFYDLYRVQIIQDGLRTRPVDVRGSFIGSSGECYSLDQELLCLGSLDQESCEQHPYCLWDEPSGCISEEIAIGGCQEASSQPECSSNTGCLWGRRFESFVARAVPPLDECFKVTPESELGVETAIETAIVEQYVVIDNRCPSSVEFQASLRTGGLGASLEEDSITGEIEANGTDTIRVLFSPTPEGSFQEILIIETLSPERGLHPVTLWRSASGR